MKRTTLVLVILLLVSCTVNYPMTTFYVKNTTDKTLNFKASIVKHSSMGPYEMTLPFEVPPHDSILVRKVGFKKGAEPTAWFTRFTIFPSGSMQFNDPNKAANWVRATDEKGRPLYIFNMVEQ